MTDSSLKTIFLKGMADDIAMIRTVSKAKANEIFAFFKDYKMFRWQDANNDCEDRANAICMLLDEWQIPNYKGWVFSGYFLKKGLGSLKNGWKYHVAAAVAVDENNAVEFYIIDPATSGALIKIENWASAVTDVSFSYHFIKPGGYYIFPDQKIEHRKWHQRNKANYRWTMQGLSGINGLSPEGKARLAFNSGKVKRTTASFKKMALQNPFPS